MRRACLLFVGLMLLATGSARADDTKSKPKPKPKPASDSPAKLPAVSFLREVAPVLVQNCIACHNPKKAESKYVMTTFAQLAKGGAQAEAANLVAGDPDGSRFVELVRLDGEPRMPYKLDPLPRESIALIERWVKEGARYDGSSPAEDWTIVLRKLMPVAIPAAYAVPLPVTALAFSPDGSTLAASGFHEVTEWKVADGTLLRRLPGLAERIYEVAFSADGKWMAVASGDPGQFGSAKLFSVDASGLASAPRDLLETSDSVLACAFSPDSKRVAAAGADRALRIWDVASGKLLVLIEDHADWVTDLAFSPDGKRMATASRDKTCKVFDVEKKESLVTFSGHAAPVQAVAFSGDGTLVASGGDDSQVRFWNPAEDARPVGQAGFGGAVFRLQPLPDGKSLLACSADKSVRLIAGTGTIAKTLSGHGDWVYAVAISRDGKTAASGSWDGEVRLWSLPDGKLLRAFTAAPGFKPAR